MATFKTLKLTLYENKIFDSTFRIIMPDKQIRYIKAYGHGVRDNAGKVSKVIGVNYDLTESFIIQENPKESIKEKTK